MKKIIGILICSLIVVSSSVTSATISYTDYKEHKSQENSSYISGHTLYVGGSGPGNYTTIQEAIADAVDGDTVFVFDDSSPYHERVRVTKSISLIGENKETTVIDGDNGDACFYLAVGWVRIQGFCIRNACYGIRANKEGYNNISRNDISKISFGILLEELSDNNVIYENRINGEEDWGILSRGIMLYCSDNNSVSRNNISSCGIGIVLGLCYNNTISENNFINNQKDVVLSFLGILHKKNTWDGNYWGKPRSRPKPIFGLVGFPIICPLLRMLWIEVDWHPAQEPYELGC